MKTISLHSKDDPRFKSRVFFGKALNRLIALILLIGTLTFAVPSIMAAPAPASKPKVDQTDPVTATLTEEVREVVKKRLINLVVSKYYSEPSKKLVQLQVVAVPNKYFPELSPQMYERESGYLFRKIFTSKYPIKRVEIKFFMPPANKELVYYIVLTEKEVKGIDWNKVENIDWGSIAVYLWPLPVNSCTGFGDL